MLERGIASDALTGNICSEEGTVGAVEAGGDLSVEAVVVSARVDSERSKASVQVVEYLTVQLPVFSRSCSVTASCMDTLAADTQCWGATRRRWLLGGWWRFDGRFFSS